MPFPMPPAAGVLLPLAVLLALIALSRFGLRRLVALFYGRQVGEQALARQPEVIHLHPAGAEPWQSPEAPVGMVRELQALGFLDAGTYGVTEMPGVHVQLLAHERGEAWASVYEFSGAGAWFDLYAHAEDGSAYTLSARNWTGLDQQPDREVVYVPGMRPGEAWEQFRQERPARRWLRASTAEAVPVFERAYAEYMTWRREHGITASEVRRVAERRVA